MKKILYLLILLIALTSCASKRYAKKGAEFETVGYYEKAAEMYYQSVIRNDKNVDAQIGLKRAGQITLDNKLDGFLKNYNANNTKEAVYLFIEADKFNKKLKSAGTTLEFPGHYRDYYNEIKDSYLNNKYNDATLLLDEENFSKAEAAFNEILKIEPNYYDAKELKDIAHYEPIYRAAKNNYIANKYRSAYYMFSDVNKAIPMYKEADEYVKKSLDKATMTLAILNFKNLSRVNRAQVALQSEVKERIIDIKSPFIKVIDRDLSGLLHDEQIYNLEGNFNSDISAKAGQLLGAKFLVTGVIEELNIHTSKLKKESKSGYLREKRVKKVDGKEEVSYKYHKATYFEFEQSRRVYCRFNFSVVSAETGEIIISDAFAISENDEIHYATFSGSKKDLYPGKWQSKTKDSPNDEVYSSKSHYKSLQNLLKADQSLKSTESLRKKVNDRIADKVASKIKKYDPEK